jgi:hypothetical protein
MVGTLDHGSSMVKREFIEIHGASRRFYFRAPDATLDAGARE